MERFVHNENTALYKKLIAESERNPKRDEDRHKMLLTLLAEEKAKDKKPETWHAIRVAISTANKLDTEDPRPLILYYRSYVEDGERPPKAARDGLYYASVLAPEDRSLRFNAASTYLADGNLEMARRMVLPLAYDPHNSGLAVSATKMIAEIDRRAAAKQAAAAPPKP